MTVLVRWSRGRLRYTGRLPRAAFSAWLGSPEGQRHLARAASRIGFTLFGRTRAARRRLLRDLREAAAMRTVAAGVQDELDRHLERVQALVYAPVLPQVGIDLRRLVVVPRRLPCADLSRRLEIAVQRHPVLAPTEDGTPLRHWFVREVIHEAEAAVARAKPSPWRPLPAGEGWVVVGVDDQFEWYAPLDGPVWPGHYHVLELRSTRLTRAVRKAVHEAILELESSISLLSRPRRIEILNDTVRLLEPRKRA